MRKILSALGFALCGSAVLAEDNALQTALNTQFSAVTTNMTTLKDALVTWGGNFLPVILGIVAVFIGYWLLRFSIRLVKSMGSASK